MAFENMTPGDIEICQDCLSLIANGEGPDDVAERLAANWPNGTITLGRSGDDPEDESEGWFSWSHCDGCDSPFGGTRYGATAWTV